MKSSNCYSFNTIYRNSFNTTEEIINALGFLEAPEMLQFRMKLFIVTTVYFSDKSRFAIYLDCGRLRVWREPNNRNRHRKIQKVHYFCYCLRRNQYRRKNRAHFARDQILAPIVVSYAAAIKPNFFYMHRNTTTHTSSIAGEFLENNNIDGLPRPELH